MKKITIILILLSITIIGFSQIDDPTTNKAVEVIDAVFDKTTEAVQGLALALKVPAEHVYSVLVKQQVVKSVSVLMSMIVCFTVGFILLRWGLNSWKAINIAYRIKNKTSSDSENRYDIDDGWWTWPFVIGIILLVIAFGIGLFGSGTIITGFANPEYGAIKTIMNII